MVDKVLSSQAESPLLHDRHISTTFTWNPKFEFRNTRAASTLLLR